MFTAAVLMINAESMITRGLLLIPMVIAYKVSFISFMYEYDKKMIHAWERMEQKTENTYIT